MQINSLASGLLDDDNKLDAVRSRHGVTRPGVCLLGNMTKGAAKSSALISSCLHCPLPVQVLGKGFTHFDKDGSGG
jgi:hypothetical protein